MKAECSACSTEHAVVRRRGWVSASDYGLGEFTGVAWQTKSARVVAFALTLTFIVATHASGAGPPGCRLGAPMTEYEPGGSVTVYEPSAATAAV